MANDLIRKSLEEFLGIPIGRPEHYNNIAAIGAAVNGIEENNNFVFLLGDIANPLILKDYKADIIIHLASQKIPRYSNALRTLEENYLMLRNIVHKCIQDKSKIILKKRKEFIRQLKKKMIPECCIGCKFIKEIQAVIRL